jgi:hypothetical protein
MAIPRRLPCFARALSALCAALAGAPAGLVACGPGAESAPGAASAPAAASERGGPPTAHWDIVDDLRQAQATVPHPADGGGRAWLESAEPEHPRASTRGRFRIGFEVGPQGIATGGGVYLQVSPFWEWSTPQVSDPQSEGYTEVRCDAPDVELEPQTLGPQLLGVLNRGRALAPGERIEIDYGAGPAGAATDRFAERGSRFWVSVDGDGDGFRKLVADSPSIDIAAGAPARLVVHVPGTARPGESVPISLAVLDAAGNSGVDFAGELSLASTTPGVLEVPERVRLGAEDAGVLRTLATAHAAGLAWVVATGPDGLEARSNPILVAQDGPRILWADLHGHSALSDGTGTPEEYLRYARDVAALDVIALTDHDHWGMVFLDESRENQQRIFEATERFNAPGSFVAISGYEWTSWIYGHRHVLRFDGEVQVISSLDPATETPQQLWRALEGQAALTFAHHSAGGPIAIDWTIPPDPRFEPVTEIASVHGSSESPDTPLPIYDAVANNWVRDALARGYRLGFVGSGDSHDGHPGLPQLASPTGGMAAIFTEERTRDAVLAALRARRTYATNGPRILLRAALGSHPMGTVAPVAEGATLDESLFVQVAGTGPIARVEIVRSGAVVDGVDGEGRLEIAFDRPVTGLRAGEYVYVRVVQQDQGAAWSSPVYIGE